MTGIASRARGVLAAGLLLCTFAACGDSPDDETATTPPANSADANTSVSTVPGVTTEPSGDDAWTVEALDTAADDAGNWSGTATLKNDGDEARAGSFIFLLSRDGETVAELAGASDVVAVGDTVEVTLESEDPFTEGEYDYDFKAAFDF